MPKQKQTSLLTDNKVESRRIGIDTIMVDESLQPRVSLDQDTVSDYAELMTTNKQALPPVVVYEDEGGKLWLASGFHRYAAAKSLDHRQMYVEVREGTRDDALLHACEANTQHGLRPTREDKCKAVAMLLDHKRFSKWSHRKIAKRCGVSHSFVNNVVAERNGNGKPKSSKPTEKVDAKPSSVEQRAAETFPADQPKAEPTQETTQTVVDEQEHEVGP